MKANLDDLIKTSNVQEEKQTKKFFYAAKKKSKEATLLVEMFSYIQTFLDSVYVVFDWKTQTQSAEMGLP